MHVLKKSDVIVVCDKCLRASCFAGVFYCEGYISAGVVNKTVSELEILALEHPSYWHMTRISEINPNA